MNKVDKVNKGGRKPLEIDEDVVEKLASIMCTMIEIASVVGCSVDTLERRFADAINRGRNKGKTSLRRFQYLAAEKGNPALLIWLGKQHLGQVERIEQDNHINMTVSNGNKEQEEIAQRLKEKAQLILENSKEKI